MCSRDDFWGGDRGEIAFGGRLSAEAARGSPVIARFSISPLILARRKNEGAEAAEVFHTVPQGASGRAEGAFLCLAVKTEDGVHPPLLIDGGARRSGRGCGA